MKDYKATYIQDKEVGLLPVHELVHDSKQINILPLDHTNPYDFKREHRHTYFEIMLIKQGGCNQLIDFKNYIGRDYSCYIICPRQIHLMNRNNATGTVLQFKEESIYSPELRIVLNQFTFYTPSAIVFENRPDLFDELQIIFNLLEKKLRESNSGKSQVSSYLLQTLIAWIIEQMDFNAKTVQDKEKKVLFDFYQVMEENYMYQKGVQFYLDKLGVTEKKLASLIKKHTGLSTLQVIHNRILLEAKRLLLFEESSHKEISYQLGFDSPASFSSFIKSKTGYSPTELSIYLAEIHK